MIQISTPDSAGFNDFETESVFKSELTVVKFN